jgi:hypothetical protein
MSQAASTAQVVSHQGHIAQVQGFQKLGLPFCVSAQTAVQSLLSPRGDVLTQRLTLSACRRRLEINGLSYSFFKEPPVVKR